MPARRGLARPRAATISAVRFPFTFMGLLSTAFGIWIAVYFALHPLSADPVVAGTGWLASALMLGFGIYVLVRRLRHGPQA